VEKSSGVGKGLSEKENLNAEKSLDAQKNLDEAIGAQSMEDDLSAAIAVIAGRKETELIAVNLIADLRAAIG
ncbi:MAG: hypothetical protein LBQ82_06940, partial [Treponema sp.]|jgi:hypothetical protein|nr:hypothetical protein [Treponema sp.]